MAPTPSASWSARDIVRSLRAADRKKIRGGATAAVMAAPEYRIGEYRIGDTIVFNGRLLTEGGVSDIQATVLASHPDSIVSAFITEARSRNFTDACYVKLDQCASILKTVTDRECPARLEASRRKGAVVAPVVVHVRTADVIDASGDLNSPLTGRRSNSTAISRA